MRTARTPRVCPSNQDVITWSSAMLPVETPAGVLEYRVMQCSFGGRTFQFQRDPEPHASNEHQYEAMDMESGEFVLLDLRDL